MNKKYFLKCDLKFTKSNRDANGNFNYQQIKVEDCLIITTEGKKTIEYITTVGAVLKLNKTRANKKKFDGLEVPKEFFESELRQRKFEVFESIQTIQDLKIKVQREKEFFNFPKTL